MNYKKIAYVSIFLVIGLIVYYFAFKKVHEMNMQNKKQENSQSINTKSAYFAGGCFWCMEPPFDNHEGVLETISGYSNGHKENPSYEEVSSGASGHIEALKIVYDPNKVTYEELLDIFWKNIDPTDQEGQFVDKGPQYISAIFYETDEEEIIAKKSRNHLQESNIFSKKIVTQIIPLDGFYPAEDYHQDYYQKNPVRYKFYRHNSGRDQFLEKKWQGRKK